MNILLLRHGMTAGNLQKRYIGRTDEPLCEEGVRDLQKRSYEMCGKLYISPMLRCRQTAQILFPNEEAHLVEDFRECDFGDFENKNYLELTHLPSYQEWLRSGGMGQFPGGEHPSAFQERCVKAFQLLGDSRQDFTVIAHGGTLMAIMAYCCGGNFYDWQVENGRGFLMQGSDWSRV